MLQSVLDKYGTWEGLWEEVALLLRQRAYFEFQVENQWWLGFTFTEPELTARLLDGIRFPNKGIILDTGHLINSNTALRTQADGAAFLMDMLGRHGTLARMVRGVHLRYSLSGACVEAHTGARSAGGLQ